LPPETQDSASAGQRWGRALLPPHPRRLLLKGVGGQFKQILSTATAAHARTYRAPPETFEAAVNRMGLNDEDLRRVHRGLRRSAYTSLCVCIGMLVIGMVAAWISAGQSITLTRAVPMIGAFLYALASALLCLASSMRAWQIRARRLGTFAEFFAQSEQILPPRDYGKDRA
jgi:hypothetical protein